MKTNKAGNFLSISVIATLLAMLTVSTTHAQQSGGAASAALNSQDKKFLIAAGQGDTSEVAVGRLAVSRGGAPSKTFGQRMVEDHGKGSTQVKQLSAQVGSSTSLTVEEDAKSLMTRLSKLSGSAFDKVYLSSMVEDHKKDIAAYEQEVKSGQNSKVKAFATQTLPMLKSHLKMAQNMTQGMGSKMKRS